jgi:hypothetical protein
VRGIRISSSASSSSSAIAASSESDTRRRSAGLNVRDMRKLDAESLRAGESSAPSDAAARFVGVEGALPLLLPPSGDQIELPSPRALPDGDAGTEPKSLDVAESTLRPAREDVTERM